MASRHPALLLSLAAVAACSQPPDRVAIGAGVSATFVDAVRMAIEDAQAEGGLPPLDTLFFAETSNRAAPALDMARQLAEVPGMVGVVAHSNSSSSLAASPIYNAAKVVQIAPTSTSVRFAESGEFSFRLVPADPMQGALLARSLDSLFPDGARVALHFVNDDYGRGLRDAVLRELDRGRHQVVLDQPHADHEATDDTVARLRLVDESVAQLAAARPTAMLWLGRIATFRLYAPRIRERLGPLPILAGDGVSSLTEADVANSDLRGVRYADFFDLDATPAGRDFQQRFAARTGTSARSSEVLSYDAARVILAAVKDGARTGEEVRAWLQSLGRTRPPWPGLSGPIAFTDRGDVERGYVLLTVGPGRP